MIYVRDGWFFERVDDFVVMTKRSAADVTELREIFTPSEWASIVAAMSSRGISQRTWDEAIESHMTQ